MKHVLKIWPQFFEAVKSGKKTFELRDNDRAFQAGDTVVLKEWFIKSQRYSFRELQFLIGYVLPVDEKRVVFSLLPPSPDAVTERKE